MTFTDILGAAGQTLLLAGLCFFVLCLFMSHFRFQVLTRTLKTQVDEGPAGAEAFQVHIAQQLGTAHRNPAPFTVMLVTPERWTQLGEQYGRPVALQLVEQVEQRLRGLLRRTDRVVRFREDVVALLLQAGREAADAIGRRALVDAARESFRIPNGPVLRVTLLAGASAFPEDGDRAGNLRSKAESALQHARVAGISPQWPPDTVAPSLPAKVTHAGTPDEEGVDQKTLLDELTGVLQESRLGPALQKYVAQCRRDEKPVSVLCLDIDYLRRYNDQYGRRTGDQLLKHVAEFLKHTTREEDLIARHAGDQFVLAMPTTSAQALAVAQRLWTGLRRTAFEGSGPGLRLTVTVGVAGFPDHGIIGRELFESAQLALRVAKSKGRNQCLLFHESMRKLAAAGEAGDAF